MWLQVELPEATTITEVEFSSAGGGFGGRGRGGAPGAVVPVGPYPIAYKLELSTDGATWTAVAEGSGTAGVTSIAFAPARAKFVRLTQTGSSENAGVWAMQRLRLLGPGNGGGSR
jgi:hypothetical protein